MDNIVAACCWDGDVLLHCPVRKERYPLNLERPAASLPQSPSRYADICALLPFDGATNFYLECRPMRECEEGGGFTSEVGFYGMAIATSFCALMGVYKVQQKQVDEHRRWMVRNIMFIHMCIYYILTQGH